MKLVFKKLKEDAKVPTMSKGKAPAFELYAYLDEDKVLFPGDIKIIRTAISFQMDERELPDLSAVLMPANELVKEKQIYLANNIGVIAGDYKGEIAVAVINGSKVMRTISNGEKIARLVVTRLSIPNLTAGDVKKS